MERNTNQQNIQSGEQQVNKRKQRPPVRLSLTDRNAVYFHITGRDRQAKKKANPQQG